LQEKKEKEEKRKLKKKAVSGMMLTLQLISLLMLSFSVHPVRAEPATIAVPDDYPTIQEAINAATEGDSIDVRAGTYYENVVVNKTVSLVGESHDSTIIQFSSERGIDIAAQNVIIEGFRVIGPGAWSETGTYSYGIFLGYDAKRVTIRNSIIENCVQSIFVLAVADENRIVNNAIADSDNGIWIDSSRNLITDNEIQAIGWDIMIQWTGAGSDPVPRENTVHSNKILSGLGLCSSRCSQNNITGNTVSDCTYGIYLGIYPEGHGITSDNEILHNNFINNVNQVYISEDSINGWDNGYPSGGNYWSDHELVDEYSGPNQDVPGSDGICDTPYTIDENNQDNYPLMTPWSPVVTLTVHNIDTGLDYAAIQEAIDAPETLDGHTISVDANTYYEAIVVSKSLNLVGRDREATIIDGSESMTVVLVKANYVGISNFTVQNSLRNVLVPSNIAAGKPAGGIALDGCVSCTIANNTIEQCAAGVVICIGSGNNIITGNIVHGGEFPAFGITDWAGPETPVGGNSISFNRIEGFEMSGILLDDTTNDEIHENRILSNNCGIALGGSNNKITQNIIKGSKEYGILSLSSDNIVCHNDFIDNAVHVYIDPAYPSTNTWDDGYPSGGNYWSDYTGVDECWGENQDGDDSGDMIGDTPYVIDENNQDKYPLMGRWSFQGDVNRDGIVNILDINLVAPAFGTDPTHPRWNYKADLNRDGIVNIIDLAIVARQWHKIRWQFE
jgi:parallel beta-helix repeat protein